MDTTDHQPIPERYLRWESFIADHQNDTRLSEYLEKFIERFPFNGSYWVRYAEEELKKSKP